MNQEESEGVMKKSEINTYWINLSRNLKKIVKRSQMNKEKKVGVNGGQGKRGKVDRK